MIKCYYSGDKFLDYIKIEKELPIGAANIAILMKYILANVFDFKSKIWDLHDIIFSENKPKIRIWK